MILDREKLKASCSRKAAVKLCKEQKSLFLRFKKNFFLKKY